MVQSRGLGLPSYPSPKLTLPPSHYPQAGCAFTLLPLLSHPLEPQPQPLRPLDPPPALSHFLREAGPEQAPPLLGQLRSLSPRTHGSRSTSPRCSKYQNRKSKLRWGSCSRSLHPPDPWSPSRTPHCPTRPPCLPRSRSPKTTSPDPDTVSPRYDWIWGDGV